MFHKATKCIELSVFFSYVKLHYLLQCPFILTSMYIFHSTTFLNGIATEYSVLTGSFPLVCRQDMH